MNRVVGGLEARVLRELLIEWRYINRVRFRERLTAPALELSDSKLRLGAWVRETRTIEISRGLVRKHPWPLVVEVLKHEMAHQYVHEALGVLDETAHGQSFARVCRDMGIDANAKGLPRTYDEREKKLIDRVTKLLALAESPNQHEAEAAMVAAKRLLSQNQLEDAFRQNQSDFAVRYLGKPNGRVGEAERLLAGILTGHFFVEAIWISAYRAEDDLRGSVLEICGRETNVSVAEYVHGYLLTTAERLWEEHKEHLGIRSNRDRRTFLAGVMSGFASKLKSEKRRLSEEGLVWVKDGQVETYFRQRHPHVRNVRYGGTARPRSYYDGHAAGQHIHIRKPVDGGRGPTKLLPAKT